MTRTGFANICTSSSSENAAYYDSIYSNFLWTAYLLHVSTFFSTDRLSFYYFRQLTLQIVSYIQVSSIILALCANSRLCCTQFFAPVTQNMWCFGQWRKPVKDSMTPVEAGREMEDSHTKQLTDSLEVSPFSTRSRYSCLISRSRRDGRPGYMVEPPDSTMCL